MVKFDNSESEWSQADNTDLDPDYQPTSCCSSSDESIRIINKCKTKFPRKFCRKTKRRQTSLLKKKTSVVNSELINSLKLKISSDSFSLSKISNQIACNRERPRTIDFSKINNESNSTSLISAISNVNCSTICDTSGYVSHSDSTENSNRTFSKMSIEGDELEDDPTFCKEVYDGVDDNIDLATELLNYDDENSVISDDSYASDVHEGNKDRVDSTSPEIDKCDIDLEKVDSIYKRFLTISSNTLEEVSKLNIDITWNLPLAHSHPNSFLVYNQEVLKNVLVEEYGKGLRSGKFTSEEDELVIKNWKNFSRLYGFKDPSIFFRGFLPKRVLSNREKKKFVQFLGRGINERCLRSIYNRFCDLLQKNIYTFGSFTSKEDQIILELEKIPESVLNDLKYSKLVVLKSILLRDNFVLWTRKRLITNYKTPRRIKWTLNKLNYFVHLLVKSCKSNDFSRINHLKPKRWKKIAKKLGCNCVQLKIFWLSRLSVQLTIDKPLYRNKLRSDIIKSLYKLIHRSEEELEWQNVDWRIISKKLNLPPIFLYKKFRKMAITFVPLHKLRSVKDTIDHLHSEFLPILKSGKLKDYTFKRLLYSEEDGLIEVD